MFFQLMSIPISVSRVLTCSYYARADDHTDQYSESDSCPYLADKPLADCGIVLRTEGLLQES